MIIFYYLYIYIFYYIICCIYKLLRRDGGVQHRAFLCGFDKCILGNLRGLASIHGLDNAVLLPYLPERRHLQPELEPGAVPGVQLLRLPHRLHRGHLHLGCPR